MDKSFWIDLQTNAIACVERNGTISERPCFCEDKLKRAFYSLEGRYRNILLMRIDKKKTLVEVGSELNLTHTRVIALERRAYSLVYRHLIAEHRPLTWDEKPLIEAKCSDTRNIEDVMKTFSANMLQSLRDGNYRTMQQLCAASPRRLMELRWIGVATVKKIDAALNAYRQFNPEYFS